MACRGVLGSSFVFLVACATQELPLGERDGGSDSGAGTGGESGAAGSDGTGGTSGTGGSGGDSGTGGSGGSGGASGAGGASACTPTDSACYPSGPGGPGSECLAQRDNSGASRVQVRSVWAKSIAPRGNTTDTIYDILRQRSQIQWPACGAPGGLGGFIQLFDWDRSNPDPLLQTLRTGYATYHRSPAPTPAAADLVRDGLCMAEYVVTAASDRFGDLPLPASSGALPFPWQVGPRTSNRVAQDFTPEEMFVQNLRLDEGRVYIDESTGYVHGYTPLSWITLLDSRSAGVAIPLRHMELKMQFNDNTFNCAGRFRAEELVPSRNCDSSDPRNPPWGCKDDAQCPPAGFPDPGDAAGRAVGPAFVRGHVLIVDLERIYSAALGATLCVTYPGIPVQEQVAQGWAAQTPEGANCRGGARWDPSLPDDAGLPMGDWCSRTNSPATVTCHDAYHVLTYGADQAFKIKDGTCPLGML